MRGLFVACAACLLAAGTNSYAQEQKSGVGFEGRDAKAAFGSWGVETNHISEDVDPGDDFYAFVNEGWLSVATLPAGRSSLSASNAVAVETRSYVNDMILELADGEPKSGTRQQRIADFYKSYLAADTIEARGLEPIQADLDAILAIASREDAARWMSQPRSSSIAPMGVWLDLKDTGRHLLWVDQNYPPQTVIGLRNRNILIKDEDPYIGQRAAYRDYIADALRLAGIDSADERADHILALETRLAEVMWGPAKLRDRKANYHLMSRQALSEFAPGFPWQALFDAQGVGDVDIVNVASDTAIQASAAIFAETPLDHWRSYLAFHWINNHDHLLPKAFGEASFAFYSGVLRGVEERSPAERRAVFFATRHLGEEIGREYVERRFSRDERTQMEQMVVYLKRAFAASIAEADWLDEPTRREALDKLDKMKVKVGFPSVWKDYADLTVDPDDPVGNFARAHDIAWRQKRDLIGKPYSDGAWYMNAHTVDASFSPQLNSIFFPAGMLQPPFFDPYADPAVNFGAIGAIIGHEIGHGFDDQGSQFDGDGHLRNWWTAEARAAFEERTGALASQYGEFEALPGVTLNAKQMSGENISDLVGVAIGLHAYHLYLADHHGGEAPELDGYTGDQRYFMAWAQAFRTIWNDEALRSQAENGYHSPGRFRANGVVRNIDAWYEAFDVDAEDDLYLPPDRRVRLW